MRNKMTVSTTTDWRLCLSMTLSTVYVNYRRPSMMAVDFPVALHNFRMCMCGINSFSFYSPHTASNGHEPGHASVFAWRSNQASSCELTLSHVFLRIALFIYITSCTRLRVATQCASAPCKVTISSYLFARWHLFRHVDYLRHRQQVDL